MQEALPYKRWETLPPNPVAVGSASPNNTTITTMSSIASLVKENPVMVLGKRGCCMCHVVRKLLLGLGVNPPVFEIDADQTNEIADVLLINYSLSSNNNNNVNLQFPVVFVGGELFGGLDRVMATHLSGELVPILKNVGALWL